MIGLKESGPAPPSAPPPGNRLRERSAQAIEYYNNNLQRARAGAGLSSARASYNDNHHSHVYKKSNNASDPLHRSNSSLELAEHPSKAPNSPGTLRREYGSHGSIDALNPGESFFAMLQEYKPAVLDAIGADQRSPGPSEYLRSRHDDASDDINSNTLPQQSPKLKVKLTRFWGSGGVHNSSKQPTKTMDDALLTSTSSSSSNIAANEPEDIARRRAFTHYDCQSMATNLSYTVRLRRNLLSKRRNTTTGASAASMVASTNSSDGENEDTGDGQNNELVESCPFFRNEIGGEGERVVSLTRLNNSKQGHSGSSNKPLHRPPLAYGVAVLEFPPGGTHWRHSTCPYQRLPRPIESVDQGALYYRKHFLGLEHQNWFGMDEQLGPIAISIRREKVPGAEAVGLVQHQYRLIIRTSELLTLRGSILEDSIPNIKASSSSSRAACTKEVLEHVAPEVQINSLRLGVPGAEQQLLKLDEQGLTNHYKVGIMYCRAHQSSEEEMYNNEEAGPAFQEFLDTIGKTVRLKDFDKYRAGLDNKSDSTGLYSVYAQYQECEIMFHVSTMLPFTPNNRQQLLRKRHIGNDIVTIVFQEPGALPFTPKGIRSQFQHVFIVVRAINPCTENTHYKVAVSRSRDVQVFGPPIKKGAVFPKGRTFADFLLAKVVNAENAAHRSEKFVTMATRTRQEYLKDLVANFSTTTPVDTGQKFSIFGKKKEKIRLRFIPDSSQRGAILWRIILDDCGQSQPVECLLGISTDSLVIIEECSRQIIFVSPCKSILGWSSQGSNSLRIYHHQGECINIHMRDLNCDRDELMEVVERLKAVTQGVNVKELTLKRNIMGQLGFHVQPDGIVTLVESQGQAWQGGLRQNSRLVEICKVAVSTLTYDSMVDLLKTSSCVTLTVIPPLVDGSPRRGCQLQNCRYNEGNYESEYETTQEGDKSKPHGQRAVPNSLRIYDRSFSPPRSSNSSGYGTGSSSKSYLAAGNEGTLTSSSSGQSTDDRWYELLQETFDLESGEKLQTSSVGNRHVSNRVNEYSSKYLSPSKGSSHNHFRTPQHSKVHTTHSLPLSHINYASLQPANEIDITFESEKNNLSKSQSDSKKDYALLSQFNTNDLSKSGYDSSTYESNKSSSKNSYEASSSSKNAYEASKNLYETSKAAAYDGKGTFERNKDGYDAGASKGQYESNKSLYDSMKAAGSSNYESKVSNYDVKNSYDSIKRDFESVKSSFDSVKNSFDLSKMGFDLPTKNYEHLNKNYDLTSRQHFVNEDRHILRSGSEDELSNSSNRSPRSSRHKNLNNLSANSSRNQSPRSHSDAKLRPGVTSRSSNRNSANLSTTNTLQEELMRLINPDDNIDPNINNKEKEGQKEFSLNLLEDESEAPEVILTMARPATVISNTSSTSSPLPAVEFKTNNERPLKTRNDVLPLPEDMDWSSLVDTATRAMMQVNEDNISNDSIEAANCWEPEPPTTTASDNSKLCKVPSSVSVPELQGHYEDAISRETRRRQSLEHEVRRLKDENRKLHEENRHLQDKVQATTSQLRKFTEWFFKNVQRQ